MREINFAEMRFVSGGELDPTAPYYPYDPTTNRDGGTTQTGTDPAGHRNAN